MTIINSSTASGVRSSRGILRTLFLLSLFIFAPAAGAATYYVSISGSNSNPGTISSPFATLQKAHDIGVAGDTIYMRGGTYPVTQVTLTRGGSSGNPIKIFNYPGEVPVLDGSSATNQFSTVIYMSGASWWHIKGLEIKNSANHGLGMWNASSNNIIENCNIHDSARLASVGSGIAVGSSANTLLLNNDVHHNRDITNGNSDGISVTSPGTGNVVRGNRAWRNSDDGLDFWNAVPVTIENNWSWENGYNDALQSTGGDGNGFKLGGTATGDGGHTIKNNLSWRNRTRGFIDNLANIAMFVYNNTAYENGASNFAFSNAVAHTLKNNISFGPSGVSLNASVKQSFNSWNLPVTVTSADFASLNFSAMATTPRNADGSLPTMNFLRLASGSDLIDKGTNVGIAYSGGAPDLGAYEFTGGVTPPPPPPPPPPISCAPTTLNVSGAVSDGGFAYIIFGTSGIPADNSTYPTRSPVRFFENGVEMGPAHSGHADIRNLGRGRFSHWSSTTGTGESLRFAASNNTNPRTNGRSYTYCVPATTSSSLSNKVSTTIASTTAPTANFSASPITVFSRPVAAYNFEEVSGSKVIDASGQGNHGTRSGTSRITQGRFGKALSFDGLNDWVTVNDAASLDLTTGMTVEAWVYPTESMTGWRTLVTKESPPDRASYYLHANSDTDQPATGVFIGDYQDVRGGPWLVPNTWVHLAGTYDGTTQRLYVNGMEVANRAQSEPIEVFGGVLRIGGNSILGEFFKGRIDEIRIYNQALSAAEITTDMNTSVAISSPPVFLVGDKNVAPATDSIPQGKAQAFQTQAAVTGWVRGLSVYVDTGSIATTLVAGLYTDENGHPGTLLAQGTLGSPGSGGWKMVSLPPVSLTAGSEYWVAILSPSGMLTFRDSGTWVGGLSETSSQSTLSELPSTWTTGTYESEGPLSAYGAGYQ